MKRKEAIALIKVAGYHNDSAAGTRLYIENRVSYQSYKDAYRLGQQSKAAGVRCTCQECQVATSTVASGAASTDERIPIFQFAKNVIPLVIWGSLIPAVAVRCPKCEVMQDHASTGAALMCVVCGWASKPCNADPQRCSVGGIDEKT